MRKLAMFVVVTSVAVMTVITPATAAPVCDTPWGSRAESTPEMAAASLVDVRAGRHRCFDRLVLELDGQVEGYDVRYVRKFRADGSGDVVPLRGKGHLAITLRAPAYDDKGRATYQVEDRSQLVDVDGFRTFRQVAWGGTFEGSTTVGLGVRARLPVRVLTLDGPGNSTRLVVDVAHSW
jgi:hypothetical protein